MVVMLKEKTTWTWREDIDDDENDDDDASMTDQLLMSPLKTKWAISIIIFLSFLEEKVFPSAS